MLVRGRGEMTDDQSDKTQASRPRTEDYVSLPPGAPVGRFEIVSVLGQGGFGITYRARDTQLDRDVAIKEYLPSSLAIRHEGSTVLPRSTQVVEDFVWGRARFLDEAKVMARLGSAPAIVRVHEFLEANGTAYVVMPLLEGETLEARLKRETRLHQPAIERILYPLLDGLEQVHAAGFLHRDIKPANIILDATGAPTLIDFGASRAAMQGRTQAITAVFTPGFAPLEQFVSGKQGPWTDIYALAATLYTCINGKPPLNAMERMIGEPMVAATEIGRRKYAPSLLAAIDAGLEVKAEDRPQTIDEWRDVLTTGRLARLGNPMLDGNALRLPPVAKSALARAETPDGPAPPTRTKARVALFTGIAAAVLLAAGVSYFALSLGSKPAPSGGALQDLKVEDLERVLADRRKADAAAAEKKRLEEEAQRKAQADAAAKRAADNELADAQVKRQKAEDELAKLKADMEARRQAEAGQQAQADAANKRAAEEAAQRKAEAEMATLRQSEAAAQKKAAAEADAQKHAEEALAKAQAERAAADAEARQKADVEAKQKAEVDAKQLAEAQAGEKAAAEAKAKADAEAKQKVDAEMAVAAEKKAAEAAETALRLTLPDRQRLQVALTSLGFDTRGIDGAFGPRSREMIAGWQKKQNQPATGFVTRAQQQALLRDAAAAVSKFDDDQKKADEAKAEAEAKAKVTASMTPTPPAPVASAPAAAPIAAAPAPTAGQSHWIGQAICTKWPRPLPINVPVSSGQGSATSEAPNGRGKVTVTFAGATMSGKIDSTSPEGFVLSGSFSAAVSGSNIKVTPTIKSLGQSGSGLRQSECAIELANVPG